MRIRPSRNMHAVQAAIYAHQQDEAGRAEGASWAKRMGGRICGPRGIVNARALGLSKHPRPRQARKRSRRAAQLALVRRRAA